MKFIILPITAPIADILMSTIVNSVATLPKSTDGGYVVVPFIDDTIPIEFYSKYDILTLTQWSELRATPEWSQEVI